MTRLVLILTAATALWGCRHVEKEKPKVVWPPPPEVARVRFVESFRQGEDFAKTSGDRFLASLAGTASSVTLKQPTGLALSADGERLYIADYSLGRVVLADFKNNKLRALDPDAPHANVFAVGLDADENVYVSVARPAGVSVLNKEGRLLRAFGGGELERPTGIAVDQERRLVYVADGSRQDSDKHRVLVYDLEGRLVREVGSGRGDADGRFSFPTFLTLDKDGNLYVADAMNFRVQVFDRDGNFLRKFGTQGDGPGHFARLKGIAFDGFGNLHVVDGGNGVVQLFNSKFQLLMWFGGLAPNLLEFFDLPSGIAIDQRTNRIYVANQGTPRINVYELINTKPTDSEDASVAKADEVGITHLAQ